jgi:transglutaminase-like putative cysteine protease
MYLFRPDPGLAPGNPMMLIQGGFNLAFECSDDTPMILAVHIRPEEAANLVEPEIITLYPAIESSLYIDSFGNKCLKLVAPPGRLSIWSRFVISNSGVPEKLPVYAYQHAVQELPPETLVYLLGSRYCDTDKLADLAWSLFGGCWQGWPLVQAILNYTHHRIRFGYHFARGDRTASEAHEEGAGVCRDYAHLAIALCRCMNIPARYCTGYLGDIGVPPNPSPMDFSAWFEVYMGGRWWALDARHNQPRIGRITIARGRDAADVAISTSFGAARLAEFKVITEA